MRRQAAEEPALAGEWRYLVHVPLVMVAQLIVRSWPLPADLKFLMVMARVTPVLLLSYRSGVRYTAIGSLLNGPRRISASADPGGSR